MRVHGTPEPQRILQQDVLGRVLKMFLPADDVRDAHQLVIDDDREVIGRISVRLANNEIVQLIGVHADFAEDGIADDHFPNVGRLESDDVPATFGEITPHRRTIEVERCPVVAELSLLRPGEDPCGLEFVGGLEGAVGLALLDELIDVLATKIRPISLMSGGQQSWDNLLQSKGRGYA